MFLDAGEGNTFKALGWAGVSSANSANHQVRAIAHTSLDTSLTGSGEWLYNSTLTARGASWSPITLAAIGAGKWFLYLS